VEAVRHASIGVVVAVKDDDGFACAFANEAIRKRLGCTPRRAPADLMLPEAAASAVRDWLGGPRDRPLALEDVPIGATGSEQLHRIVVSEADVGNVRAAVFFFFDTGVSMRVLEESRSRFRRLLDAVPDAVVFGTRSRFFYANPACVKLLGRATMQEVIDTPLQDQIHPDDLAAAQHMLRSMLSAGETAEPVHLRLIGKDGRTIHVEARPIAMEWDGEPALLGVGRDLTERRRVQSQLIRADRLSAMGTLAAGVAHEINNPLAYLMLNLQYLMRELPRFDGDATRLEALLERLSEAEHGARRVSTIVGDLRTLSRADQVGLGPISVREAAARAVKLVGTEIRSRAQIVEDYEDAPPVNGNMTRLEQVFANLLVNAAQALPAGHALEHEIRIIVRHENGAVVTSVRDTGCGIDPSILGRIFDPFFTTKPRGVGTGLGLPISRGIVKSFGGEITVASTVDAGTTFRVSLPALNEVAAPVKRDTPTDGTRAVAAPPARRGRVLIVDDERPVADMLQRALADSHDVTVATDARAALDFMLAGAEYDVVFCDLLMPRMSGMDLYAELRARLPGVEESIVFMTGGAFTERAAQFLAKVPNRKMTKPFDLVELERVVSSALRKES
jgi:PAS domain S-box-containing protein